MRPKEILEAAFEKALLNGFPTYGINIPNYFATIDDIVNKEIQLENTFFFDFNFFYAFWRGNVIMNVYKFKLLYEYCPAKAIIYLKNFL